MIEDIIACFWFIMYKESSLNESNFRKFDRFVNYPQWLVATSKHGWGKMGSMSLTDQGALYPLNVTQRRLSSIVENRNSHIAKSFKIAKQVVKRKKLPESYILQIAVMIESNIWINWRSIPAARRQVLYLNLWVGFSGSLWREQRDKLIQYK